VWTIEIAGTLLACLSFEEEAARKIMRDHQITERRHLNFRVTGTMTGYRYDEQRGTQ
jgi:hypothetical protein